MNLLCKKYCRYLIALCMITALYGKSVICLAYNAFTGTYASIADAGEVSAEETESGTETPSKPYKKSCPDMEYEQVTLSFRPINRQSTYLKDPAHSQDLPFSFQKVPTQPPLRLQA